MISSVTANQECVNDIAASEILSYLLLAIQGLPQCKNIFSSLFIIYIDTFFFIAVFLLNPIIDFFFNFLVGFCSKYIFLIKKMLERRKKKSVCVCVCVC